MTDIFISYSHRDKPQAAMFAQHFEALGYSVWWDVGLRAGEAFDQAIERALRDAKAVVVLWSAHSVESRWVGAEAMLADRCKTLLPVMIGACERPIIFELTHTAELGHWQGAPDDSAWLALLNDLQRMVAQPAAAPSAALPAFPAPTIAETLKTGQSGSAPSLAVLHFTNRSGLADDEVFAEAMVEDVITALSQGVNVRVLSAAASADLNTAAISDPAALGRQLGVRYLLEGNVRRVADNLRVTTQLLEVATGEVVWTARFDRRLADLGELQEDLVTEVAAILETQVYSLEMERAPKKPSDISAWEAVARSFSAYRSYDANALQRATDEAQRAIAIAPDYAPGYAALANALANGYFSIGRDDTGVAAGIREIAQRALGLAPDDVTVLGYAGLAHCFTGYPEEGERYAGRAQRMAPGSGIWRFYHGIACVMLDQAATALTHFDAAERLMRNSHMLWGLKMWQAIAHRELRHWPEANAAIDESIALLPAFGQNHVYKAHLCVQLGEEAAARRHIEMARKLGAKQSHAERFWRRMVPASPTLDANLAVIDVLYAATEAAA